MQCFGVFEKSWLLIIMLFRLLFTLVHLKPEQFFFRLYYRFFGFFVRLVADLPLGHLSLRDWRSLWSSPKIGNSSLLSPGVFEFLGEVGFVSSVEDWNSPIKSKLWLYNLHYLDSLNAGGSNDCLESGLWLIREWGRCNPPFAGNGWEPYPLALRIVNVIKWLSRNPNFKYEFSSSLARQAQALYAQEERHLLANHLFVDGKALVFAGAFFEGKAADRWLSRGLKILDKEMAQQFLDDGGNFELSPMYHASLLWDVCDLIRLAQLTDMPCLVMRASGWREVLTRGLRWLRLMVHPDGEVSFFNDSSFGVAPRLDDLVKYASLVGCDPAFVDGSGVRCTHLSKTGYVVVDFEPGFRAILDVGEVGPLYQPGHAHADTLSFEFSAFGQRVLVNSGTSQYGNDAERHRQRSTFSHNTLTINGANSSDVWAGFRVGRRAVPFGLTLRTWGGGAEIVCSHDGYKRIFRRAIHTRTWAATSNSLTILDSILGPFDTAVVRFHLHPDVFISDDGCLVLKNGNKIYFFVVGGSWVVEKTTWHPRFGVSVSNQCIEIHPEVRDVSIEFQWR